LFTLVSSTTDSWDDASLAVASMTTGQYKVVLEGGSQARYSPTGHIVYARIGILFAVAFDLEKLEVTGQPVPVLRGVMTYPRFGGVAFALSETGSLVYAPGPSKLSDSRVVWVDRDGRTEQLIENLGPLQTLDLSPDGRVLAIQNLGGIDHIWLYDIERGTLRRWSSEWDHFTPVWVPSGREIAFASARGGAWGLYKQALDTGAKEELLTTSEYMQVATSWSPDGAVLLFDKYGVETGADVWMLSLSSDLTPEPLINGRANENWAAFSPNGKWIAYQSDETGRFEVYLRPFPTGGEIRQVSSGGGDHPTWNPNGEELFYASGDKMTAVTVNIEGDLVVGRPSVLFERRRNPELPNFAVTPDGQRFIFIDDSVAEPAPTHLVLVQNFGEELKRLAPPRN
jgi:serine/threonine-protein kinase